MHKKGAVLFMVLGTVLIAVILANIILGFILSHYRFTYHQTSRVKAYYAALAGMNLARENLRTGAWETGTYTLCKSNCDVNDSDIPYNVTITISDPNPVGTNPVGIRPIKITTNYTYTETP